MSRIMLVVVLLFLLATVRLPADDWAPATTQEVFSKNGQYFVRIIPGESIGETWGFAGGKVGKHAHAEFFRVQPDRSYRLDHEIDLLNPVAPTSFFVSDTGDLITLDNWHNVGYGFVIALYHSDGKLVKSYRLADLFPKKEVESFSQSVSSIWWHKGPTYVDNDQKIFYIGYQEPPDYRDLLLNLGDGSVRLCSSAPKYHCWKPQPRSN